MRATLALALLACAAAATPPAVPDYMRLRALREQVQSRVQLLLAEEDFARKPDEEKMLIAFQKGEKQLGKTVLTGEGVVKTCLKWPDC